MAMNDDFQARQDLPGRSRKADDDPLYDAAHSFPGDEAVAEELRAFASEHPEVLAVYVFGSEASGTAGPLSDIDVALLLDTDTLADAAAEQPFGPQAYYTTALQAALRRPDADVVLLHRASPLLAHRVIAQGRLVFCRDDRARSAFHARTLMRCLDTRPLRQLEHDYLRRRLAEDRFGRGRNDAAPTGATDAG